MTKTFLTVTVALLALLPPAAAIGAAAGTIGNEGADPAPEPVRNPARNPARTAAPANGGAVLSTGAARARDRFDSATSTGAWRSDAIRTTGNVQGGRVQVTTGLADDTKPVDCDDGAAISDTLRFHPGGVCRAGEGQRRVGNLGPFDITQASIPQHAIGVGRAADGRTISTSLRLDL